MTNFLNSNENEAVKSFARSTLTRLKTRFIIDENFIAAALLDPEQSSSKAVKDHLEANKISGLEILKTIFDETKSYYDDELPNPNLLSTQTSPVPALLSEESVELSVKDFLLKMLILFSFRHR